MYASVYVCEQILMVMIFFVYIVSMLSNGVSESKASGKKNTGQFYAQVYNIYICQQICLT